MTPSKDQINLARRLVERNAFSDNEIRVRMDKLKKIQKGEGHPMYESLRIILSERSMGQK